jgi:hypothetical protein
MKARWESSACSTTESSGPRSYLEEIASPTLCLPGREYTVSSVEREVRRPRVRKSCNVDDAARRKSIHRGMGAPNVQSPSSAWVAWTCSIEEYEGMRYEMRCEKRWHRRLGKGIHAMQSSMVAGVMFILKYHTAFACAGTSGSSLPICSSTKRTPRAMQLFSCLSEPKAVSS